jgi:regulator of sigma E protease
MDFLASMGSNAWAGLTYAGPFLFLLCVVVFIHELGHFLVGRWCGVKVETFSLGFGPEIWGFNDKHGTRWRLSAVPLGGYVKFFGDLNAASVADQEKLAAMSEAERRVSFPLKPLWQRAAVVVAGPVANFILAIVLFAGVAIFFGRVVVQPYVGGVVENSVAEKAGFQRGDRILAINGDPIRTFEGMQRFVSASPGVPLSIDVERAGQRVTLSATPALREIKNRLGVTRVGQIGIRGGGDPSYVTREYFGPLDALGHGAKESWFIVERTLNYLGKLITGRESTDQLSGILRIGQASGEVTKSDGFVGLLALTAVMSVSIGLLNLFPIPLLDGGHLMFYAWEAVFRRPVSEKHMEYGYRVGFALVIGLMVLATWNDIVHLVSL